MKTEHFVFIACLILPLCACNTEPTAIQIPSGAKDVQRTSLLSGRAYQTDFILEAPYPSTPALAFYRQHLRGHWVLCEWDSPGWSSFIKIQEAKHTTVHQQLYMWLNPDENRRLMLSMRYYSASNVQTSPDNMLQHVALVEYFNIDVSDTIEQLNLKCPGM